MARVRMHSECRCSVLLGQLLLCIIESVAVNDPLISGLSTLPPWGFERLGLGDDGHSTGTKVVLDYRIYTQSQCLWR